MLDTADCASAIIQDIVVEAFTDAFNNIQIHRGYDDLDRCAKQQGMSESITMPYHH
jgi:hypothetical protein